MIRRAPLVLCLLALTSCVRQKSADEKKALNEFCQELDFGRTEASSYFMRAEQALEHKDCAVFNESALEAQAYLRGLHRFAAAFQSVLSSEHMFPGLEPSEMLQLRQAVEKCRAGRVELGKQQLAGARQEFMQRADAVQAECVKRGFKPLGK